MDLNESRVRARYGRIPQDDQVVGYLKALKVIAGADGSIPKAEADALSKGMDRLGVPDATRKEIEAFDFKKAKLEDVLPAMKQGGLRARMLLRDAVDLARADGTYAAKEKAAVAKAAKLLGVDSATLGSIEALVELEHSVAHLRKALFPKKK